MAGFFLWNNKISIPNQKVLSSFQDLGYKPGKILQFGNWNVAVFQKQLYEIENFKEFNDGVICCTGTFGYKGKVYEQTLDAIYHDYQNNCLEITGFWGSFSIIILTAKGATIIRDGACLSRIYTYESTPVFSSSFAAIIQILDAAFTFHKEAATELLATGVLTGNATIVAEIKRLTSGSQNKFINLIESKAKTYSEPKNRDEALEQQIEITSNFYKTVFSDFQNYLPDVRFDIGITGGMDSRLNIALALKTTDKQKLCLHTHWRKAGMADSDYKYAHIFAEQMNMPLHKVEVLSPMDMTEQQLSENFEAAFQLSDGVIRPGCYWDEAYSTSAYREKLAKAPYLRLLGFGGEQYRNGERYPLRSSRSLQSWVRWEMLYFFAGRYFITESEAQKTEQRIVNNLIQLFGKKPTLNLRNHKTYIRLVQSPSYRSLQASMENRLGFCLNMFLDTQLSVPSELCIPFLGKSLSFQLDMIQRISPQAAQIPNGYGFNFAKGEPLKSKIGANIWQLLPPAIKHPVYAKLKKYNFSQHIPMLAKKHFFISQLEEFVQSTGIPIDFKYHRLVRSRGRLILNLGYFLKKYENKLII